LEYLVCWKGYGVEEDEWRPAKEVKGMKRLVAEFHHRNPEAPQYISSLDFACLPFCLITNFTNTQTQYHQDGPSVIACQDNAPLKGG